MTRRSKPSVSAVRLRLVAHRCPIHTPAGARYICCGLAAGVWAKLPREAPRIVVANPSDVFRLRPTRTKQ